MCGAAIILIPATIRARVLQPLQLSQQCRRPPRRYQRRALPHAAVLEALQQGRARLRDAWPYRAVTTMDVLVPSFRAQPEVLEGLLQARWVEAGGERARWLAAWGTCRRSMYAVRLAAWNRPGAMLHLALTWFVAPWPASPPAA